MLSVYVPVKSYNINYIIQWTDNTPLAFAAAEGNTEMISLLIAHGANVNMKDEVS